MKGAPVRMNGKVCVVTGGASGIGRATAHLFAREGAKVVVADLAADAAHDCAREIGHGAIAIGTDVCDEASVADSLDQAVATFGRLDVLVNKAGLAFRGDITQTSLEDWARLLAVNLTGVFLGSKAAIGKMRVAGGGVIINTASVAGLVGVRERAAYCATKGGVVAMTRAMALDHVDDGIRINAVAPGTIDSPYFDSIFARAEDPAALRRQYENRQPMRRMGTPDEVARSILWLASDEASFVTGSVLVVDGGMTAQ